MRTILHQCLLMLGLVFLRCGCLCMLAVCLISGGAEIPAFHWSASLGGSGDDVGLSTAVDHAGNVFATGYFTGGALLGDAQIIGKARREGFLAKFDPDGRVLWFKVFGGLRDDEGRSLVVDKEGNCFLAGVFRGNVNFVGTNLVGRGGADAFVAKFDPVGQLAWVRTISPISTNASAAANAVAVDNAGRCLVAGVFTRQVELGAGFLESAGEADVFLALIDAAGGFVQARSAGGLSGDEARSAAFDGQGNLFIAGTFSSEASFGTHSLASQGVSDAFITKLDPEGRFLWAKGLGGNGRDVGTSLAVNSSGDCFLAGSISGTVDLGKVQLRSRGDTDAFAAKFNAGGNLLWAWSGGGPATDEAHSVVSAPGGECHVAGYFTSSAVFDTVAFRTSGNADFFIAKLDEAGRMRFAVRSGGTGYTDLKALSRGLDGSLALTGYFRGSTTLGGDALQNRGDRDAFITRAYEPPTLSMLHSGRSQAIQWLALPPGFRLESVTNLSAGQRWQLETNVSPFVVGGMVLSNISVKPAHFFRLRRP